MTGPESSHLPSPTGGSTTSNTPAIIGGAVVGGVIGLGLVVALITFIVLRSKRKSRENNDSNLQRSAHEGFIDTTTVPLPSGSPGVS